MQIFYAAPFVLLSILGFVICLAIPRLRRFAITALIVPVTFGLGALIGWIIFALFIADEFKPKLIQGLPVTGAHLVAVAAVVFWFIPGVLASWGAVWTTGFVQRRFLRKRFARNLVFCIMTSGVAGFVGGFIGFVAAVNRLPRGSEVATVEIAFASAALSTVLAFLLTAAIQRRDGRTAAPDSNSNDL